MKKYHSLNSLLATLNRPIFMLILMGGILLSVIPAYAQKKPTGTIIGPTGILGAYQPTWPKKPTEIQVTYIEKGSPAAGADLKVGDTIVGIGDEAFKKHPLWEMASAIDAAEGEGKTLALLLKTGKTVDITLATLGTYSPTAPYNCAKTDTIIKQAADRLLKEDFGGTATRTGLLALMATGEKKHLDAVAKAIHSGDLLKIDPKKVDDYLNGGPTQFGSCGWTWGYSLIALGEYYLLTKDETVLPAIRTYALGLARGQDGVGCWGHRMAIGAKHRAPGYGTMNQPTISNLMGMLIARKCGIKDPVFDAALARTSATVEHVVGKGGFSYGSGGVYSSMYNNNGTSGSAAICMSLKGNQKGASYFSQCAATAYGSLTSGHASAFFNPLWTPLGASLSGPEVTRQFFMKSLWYFTNRRHWRGGFPDRDNAGFVAGQALLMYCLPRKVLLITGREGDESIFVKGAEATNVIMRSGIDYKKKSIDELLVMLNDPFIQVRLATRKELNNRANGMVKRQKPDTITPKILAIIEAGDEQQKINAIPYLGGCSEAVAASHAELLGKIARDKAAAFNVRVAAASTLGSGVFKDAALPYYNDILALVLEKRTEPDPFRDVDSTLAKALQGISSSSKTKPLDEACNADKKLLYKVADKFLDHKRQSVRQAGISMAVGIPKEDFPIIAGKLLYVLNDQAPDYHTYSSVLNVDGINILADLNIKEGLDLLVDGIFHKGGKWGFKYRALIKALPLYGANAKPYIATFEAHKDINKKGDRFTPAWQAAVKKINEDKHPKTLMTIEEVLRAAKQD